MWHRFAAQFRTSGGIVKEANSEKCDMPLSTLLNCHKRFESSCFLGDSDRVKDEIISLKHLPV